VSVIRDVHLVENLENLLTDQAAWSQETFGSDEVRGPLGAAKHLCKEAEELRDALGTETDLEELADCQLLLWDIARRSGYTFQQLLEACKLKMGINKARTWPKPINDEPVEHVRT